MNILFSYHESDDATATILNMDWDAVKELIQEHNEYFETNYQTIQEFNDGEAEANEIRSIEVVLYNYIYN